MMPEYIEKEAFVEKTCSECGWGCKPGDRFCLTIEKVMRASAADVAPVVHGKWIHDINNLYGCSECMKRETMSPKKLKHYCPNCGARMDGE